MTHHRHALLIALATLAALGLGAAPGCSLVTDFSSHDGDRDGGTNNGNNNNVVPPTCGNGTREEGETCDDENDTDWDGCTGCQPSERQIPTDPSGDQTPVAVAVSAEGDVAIVWVNQGGGSPATLRMRIFYSDFRNLWADHQLDTPPLGLDTTVLVGWSAVGDAIVAFASTDQPVGYNHVTDWGAQDSGTVTLDDTGQTDVDLPAMSCREGEGCVVVWQSNRGGRWGVTGHRIDSTGAATGANVDLSGSTPNNCVTPAVALRPDSSYAVLWKEVGTSNKLRVYDASGSPAGAASTFSDGNGVGLLSLATDGTGFLALYSGEPLGFATVLAQKFDASGARVGGEFAVSDLAEEVYEEVRTSAAAACTEAGTYLGVYTTAPGTGGSNVRLQVAEDEDGRTPLRLNRYDPGGVELPVLACASESSRCVAAWVDRGQDGDGRGVFAIPLDVSDAPVTVYPDPE